MDKMDKKDHRLTVPYSGQSTVTECGEEFNLPDYYPEVRRVVSTLCRVLPESLYDSGDSLEQGGVVAFTVLYLGDDGALAAVPLTCDFSAVLQLPSDRGDCVISATTTAEAVTCRCVAPRRLSLKARLRTTAAGDRRIGAEPSITADGGTPTAAEKISVQTLEKTLPQMRRATGKVTGTVSGEIRDRAGTKPVMCDGEIMINEASLTDGGVTLRGEAVLWCICFGGDGLYYKTVSRVPFEEKVPLDGDELNGGSARGWGRCAAVSVKDSEDGTLVWDMEYDLECEAAQNAEVILAADMYSAMHGGSTVMEECETLSLLRCHTGRLSISGSGGRGGNITPGDYAIGSFGKAVCDRVDRSGSRLTVTGTAEVRVPMCGGGEAFEECVKLPFRYECDCPGDGDGELVWRCDAAVTDCSARLEGDRVNVTAELGISLFAGLRTPTAYVKSLELDRTVGIPDGDNVVRIYYPEEGETAWDITKKYRIPRTAVTEVSPDGVMIE